MYFSPFQVSLRSDNYIFTEPGDVLGFTNEGVSSAIGYDVEHDVTYRRSLSSTLDDDMPQVGDVRTFTQTRQQYNYALGVRYDTSEWHQSIRSTHY